MADRVVVQVQRAEVRVQLGTVPVSTVGDGLTEAEVQALIDASVAALVRTVAVTRAGSAGAGASTSTTILTGRVVGLTVVATAHDGGAAATIGWSSDAAALATLDSSLLAAGGSWTWAIDEAVAGTGALVVTVTGSPTTGSLRVTAHYATPET